jgi:hypothetical protein
MPGSRWTNLIARAVLAILVAAGSSPAPAAEKLKLLIIDGQNNQNGQARTPPMKDELEKSGRFAVEVSTTPPANAPREDWKQFHPEFSKYSVVLSNYNGQLWPDDVQVDLVKFVGNGGGLVVIHAANNAFPEWGEWNIW